MVYLASVYHESSENACVTADKYLMNTDCIRKIRSKGDKDTRIGLKTPAKNSGYKTHIAMSDNQIIAEIEVPNSITSDGSQLPQLIDKSNEN